MQASLIAVDKQWSYFSETSLVESALEFKQPNPGSPTWEKDQKTDKRKIRQEDRVSCQKSEFRVSRRVSVTQRRYSEYRTIATRTKNAQQCQSWSERVAGNLFTRGSNLAGSAFFSQKKLREGWFLSRILRDYSRLFSQRNELELVKTEEYMSRANGGLVWVRRML